MARINRIAAKDFCTYHNLEYDFIIMLQEYEIIELEKENRAIYIPLKYLKKIETITRLYHDLNLNAEGIHVVLQLLDKLNEKENELKTLKNELDFLKGFNY